MKTPIIIAAIVLIITLVFVGGSIYVHNKEAKEKGTTEKGYNLWSILSAFFIGIFVIGYEVLREIFFPRRRRL